MEILNIAIVSTFLSVVFQFAKQYIVSEYRLAFLILFCILAGTGYYFLQSNANWLNIVSQILTFASLIYVALVKPIDNKLVERKLDNLNNQ